MREELKILLLGIGVLVIGGLTLNFYRSLNLDHPADKLATPMATPAALVATPDFYTLATTKNSLSLLVGTTTLNLELATTSTTQEQGLSNRTNLSPDSGLLFVFEKPGLYGFWMKDMNFALDLIWLNEEGKIIDITVAATPDSYPHIFYPAEPVRYVIEVNAGYVNSHNLEIGDSLQAIL